MTFLAAVTGLGQGEGLAFGVVLAVFLAGLRHGFDIDHIAAITDITSSQTDRKRALQLATTYALGHMAVVLTLGLVAVLAGKSIPTSAGSIAGQVIGATLLALGLYVLYSLIRFRRAFRMQSRWMLVIAAARRALDRIRRPRYVVIEHEHEHGSGHHAHSDVRARTSSPATRGEGALATATTHTHNHSHVVPMPSDPFTEYGIKSSFVIGMIHGVGAETPTQVLLFASAAGIAGSFGGVTLVLIFAFGLLLGNSILAIAGTTGFALGLKLPPVYLTLAAGTALVSIYVGAAYLTERTDMLPAILGGS
ncbi:MAG: hypothetical protein M3345_08570 [Actinomycetota bacterium]|nr:hypothetical protein [Actinomycetota bacterium]